jgi:hypothetical protein
MLVVLTAGYHRLSISHHPIARDPNESGFFDEHEP